MTTAGRSSPVPPPSPGPPTPRLLEVTLPEGGTQRIEAAHYLIATGSGPWAPPVDGLEEAGYLTSTTAMELVRLVATNVKKLVNNNSN
jgi:mercuric reductase